MFWWKKFVFQRTTCHHSARCCVLCWSPYSSKATVLPQISQTEFLRSVVRVPVLLDKLFVPFMFSGDHTSSKGAEVQLWPCMQGECLPYGSHVSSCNNTKSSELLHRKVPHPGTNSCRTPALGWRWQRWREQRSQPQYRGKGHYQLHRHCRRTTGQTVFKPSSGRFRFSSVFYVPNRSRHNNPSVIFSPLVHRKLAASLVKMKRWKSPLRTVLYSTEFRSWGPDGNGTRGSWCCCTSTSGRITLPFLYSVCYVCCVHRYIGICKEALHASWVHELTEPRIYIDLTRLGAGIKKSTKWYESCFWFCRRLPWAPCSWSWLLVTWPVPSTFATWRPIWVLRTIW